MDSIGNRNPIRYAGSRWWCDRWPMCVMCEGLQPDMISYKSSAFVFAQVPPNGPEGMLEKTAGVYEDMKIWRVKIFIHPQKKASLI